MWNTKDFLKMMKVHHDVFGDKILKVDEADEEYLVKYFEKQLRKLLDCWVILQYPKYFTAKCNGWTGIESVRFKGFHLNATQCVVLANEYIICKNYWRKELASDKFVPCLTPEQSRQVLDQIMAWRNDNKLRCDNIYCSAYGRCKSLLDCVDKETRNKAKKKLKDKSG